MSRVRHLVDLPDLASARPYAERFEDEPGWLDRAGAWVFERLPAFPRADERPDAVLARVEPFERAMKLASDGEIQARARALRGRFRRAGLAPELVGECFALVREAAARSLAKRHYDCQLVAGWAMFHGRLAEMATGEGKTLAATLPTAAMALAGYPAHVVTVNDYLATRDAHEMAPLYQFLGLSAGVVIAGMKPPERRAAYAHPVTYCSNKELAFDYLRDRVAVRRRGSRMHLALDRLKPDARDDRLVLRGLWFALVDEADSVFIDEARTPLILSASVRGDDERADCEHALDCAAELEAGSDYRLHPGDRRVALTDAGRARIADWAEGRPGLWRSARAREELVYQALTARAFFRRDQHYVVADGKVVIVDESTGRVMPDRSWERGLHQLIEAKEGCELSDRRETLARITYQRLFRRYLRLAGMTGTGREVAREIRDVYRLDVVDVPLNKPSRRQDLGACLVRTRAEKWKRVAAAAERLASQGRPVLVGTRSVAASEELSAELAARGVAHALLNAKQDREEAEIIARAGEAGRVTVATNMAGRGTDIALGEGVAEAGGLHVILTEYHESARIDRQLFGRCARQGDPGSCEAVVSLEDELFQAHAPALVQLALAKLAPGGVETGATLAALRAAAQAAAGRRAFEARSQNLKLDRRLEKLLAFSGGSE